MGLAVFLSGLLSLLLAAATATAPTGCNVVINREVFLESNVKYTSQHDIVSIVVPLNKINFDDDDDDDDDEIEEVEVDHVTFFFTEADVDENGDKQYKGLYVFNYGKVTKVLENGRGATAFNDDSKKVYIGASDGIYIYEDGTTKKYGELSDNIIQIEADNQTGTVYFLTKDHQLYSVEDEGATKNKVDSVTDVKEFVVDYSSNIYYLDSNKKVHVFNTEGIKKFDDLPKSSSVQLVRPMFAQEEGAYVKVGKDAYLLQPNGTSIRTGILFDVAPTAFAPEATLLQYHALDKKIYEFNILKLLESTLVEVRKYLEDKKDDIRNIATKSRSDFGV